MVAMRIQSQKRSVAILLLPFLISILAPMVSNLASAEVEEGSMTPEETWSEDYLNYVFPWGGNEQIQFKEYHTYESMKTRMMVLAQANSDIFEFHEGLNGGTNDRGQETTIDDYEGWYYGHASPWLKVTGDVQGGDYNAFNGDNGNYADRPDIMIVGNHHAREWMSYETPLLVMETIAYYYDEPPTDNDGDGLYDEDPWGDADGDGIVDDDGDCLALAPEFQDSNGDGKACNPGDLGVDEDFSEVELTNLINQREICRWQYLRPRGILSSSCLGILSFWWMEEKPAR
ncbi:MAG: M14 family zinc carboxypeptidase [Candidatus Poseidoniales archaeon]